MAELARLGAGAALGVLAQEIMNGLNGVFHELRKAEVEEMPLLLKNDNWDLFCSHAFPEGSFWAGKSVAIAEEVCKE